MKNNEQLIPAAVGPKIESYIIEGDADTAELILVAFGFPRPLYLERRHKDYLASRAKDVVASEPYSSTLAPAHASLQNGTRHLIEQPMLYANL